MSIEGQIIEALRAQAPQFAHVEEKDLDPIQANAFRLDASPPCFVKYLADEDQLGRNELWVNQTILRQASIPCPVLKFTLNMPGATIACWEWLDGDDLRYQNRHRLPQAFEQLGYFHLQQRHKNPVASQVTHRSYDTLQALLSSEWSFLTANLDARVRQHAKIAFALLETGYATYIHGDMHPGNIRVCGNDLQFVDWGYCIPSLSLFDLGYIRTVSFKDQEQDRGWWHIDPEEARSVLPAYYAACGLGKVDYSGLHRAVMLWSELWAYHNSVRHDDESGARTVLSHIDQLIVLGWE